MKQKKRAIISNKSININMIQCEYTQENTSKRKKVKSMENIIKDRQAVDTKELQKMIGAGYKTAVKIGTEAGARIKIGRRVLWNVGKIQKYLDMISE